MSDLNNIIQPWLKSHPGGTETWGPKFWHWFHELAEAIPCSTCQPVGVKLMHGFHDIVNVKLNKAVRYPHDLQFLAEAATKALNRCSSEGHCSPISRNICTGKRY